MRHEHGGPGKKWLEAQGAEVVLSPSAVRLLFAMIAAEQNGFSRIRDTINVLGLPNDTTNGIKQALGRLLKARFVERIEMPSRGRKVYQPKGIYRVVRGLKFERA